MKKHFKTSDILFIMLLLLSACSSMTVSEKQQKRSMLNTMADDAISGLVDNNPEIPQQIEHSFGYAVANMNLNPKLHF